MTMKNVLMEISHQEGRILSKRKQYIKLPNWNISGKAWRIKEIKPNIKYSSYGLILEIICSSVHKLDVE